MRFAIFGTGVFGREVAPFAAHHHAMGYTGREVVFVSDFDEENPNGRPVLRLEDLTPSDEIVIAVADAAARRKIAARCEAAGLGFGSIWAPDCIRYDEVEVGEGAIFCPRSTVTSNVRIGRHFHANFYAHVGHDCVIGDFVTFAPSVRCNGNVTIADDLYVGTAALLKPGIRIGERAVIGMGAVVTKDVPAGVTVVGNPARPLQPKS